MKQTDIIENKQLLCLKSIINEFPFTNKNKRLLMNEEIHKKHVQPICPFTITMSKAKRKNRGRALTNSSMEIQRPGSSQPWNVSVAHSLLNTPTNHILPDANKKSIAIEDHLFRPSSKRKRRENNVSKRSDFNRSIDFEYKDSNSK